MIVLVGLTVIVFSDRVRQQIRIFVSRNFHRPTHDYPAVWSALTQRNASKIDQTDLCRAVVKAVSETFDLLSVTIWRVNEHDRSMVFGASTSLTEEKAAALDIGYCSSIVNLAKMSDVITVHVASTSDANGPGSEPHSMAPPAS